MQNRRMVGARISELRKAQGLSLRKLAHMVSMDYSYICNIENGQANPTLDVLTKIATGLDVKVSTFFSPTGHTDYAYMSFD